MQDTITTLQIAIKKGQKMNVKKFCIIFIVFIIFIIFLRNINFSTRKPYFKQDGKLIMRSAYQQAVLLNDNEIMITGGITKEQNSFNLKIAQIYSI